MKDENFAGNSKSTIDFLGNKWEYDCMGCAIANGEMKTPGGIIYEGKYTILVADPEIPIPGFFIVNIKKHINSFSQLNKEEREEIGDIIVYAQRAIKKICNVKEITLVQEERASHFHIWIFPNYSWMNEKIGKGITYLRDICEYSKTNANKDIIEEVLYIAKKAKEYFKEIYK